MVATSDHCLQSQNQNRLLVTCQNDNHSPGSGPGKLVPSFHLATPSSAPSAQEKRVWKCIPIPIGREGGGEARCVCVGGGGATLISISISFSNGDLICHRIMIPAVPNQEDKVVCCYTGFTLQTFV